MRRHALRALALGAALTCAAALPATAARKVTLAVISLADDARYAKRRLEMAYPGQPQGRALEGVQLAVEDSELELRDAGIELQVRELMLPGADAVPEALRQLQAEQVTHIVADLPAPALRSLVRGAEAAPGTMVFNTAMPDDELRTNGCHPGLLHTAPSQQMEADALAQFLAARKWRKVLVLQGPLPEDAALGAAWTRAAQAQNLQTVATRGFKLGGEGAERDLANVRKLTGGPDYDVIAVLDSDGEFARSVPYAAQSPRPVVGAAGLVAQAWHPQWQRYGGMQLNRRFRKLAQRPMQGADWSAWMAGKAMVAALVQAPQASSAQQLRSLRSGAVFLDGFKGQRLAFRPEDGQLRQPVLLSHGDAVAAMSAMSEAAASGGCPAAPASDGAMAQ